MRELCGLLQGRPDEGMAMREKSVCFAALALGLSAAAGADGLNVTPGLWESTSEISVSLADEAAAETLLESRTEITQSCVTQQDHILDAIELAGPGCTVSDLWVEGPAMSFVLVCKHSEITFYGTMVASAAEDGRSTVAQMTLKGRRSDGQEIHIRADMAGTLRGPCGG